MAAFNLLVWRKHIGPLPFQSDLSCAKCAVHHLHVVRSARCKLDGQGSRNSSACSSHYLEASGNTSVDGHRHVGGDAAQSSPQRGLDETSFKHDTALTYTKSSSILSPVPSPPNIVHFLATDATPTCSITSSSTTATS